MTRLLTRLARRPDADQKVAELGRLDLFAGLGSRELRFLATHLDEVRVPAGQALVREGRRNDAFWVILEGEARISPGGGPGRLLSRGGFFGATSMLDGRPAVATVVTSTEVRALVAGSDQFRALEANDRVAMRLMAAALRRLRDDLEVYQAAGA